jgi:hypothetical protein
VPTIHELELAQLVNAERDLHVEADTLVRAVEDGTRSIDILRAIVGELALESAALKLEIRSAQSASKSDGLPQKHSRRIDALTKIAAITLEAHKLGLIELDLHADGVQRVFEFFVDTINAVANSTLQSPEAFTNAFRDALVGWEERVDLGTSR